MYVFWGKMDFNPLRFWPCGFGSYHTKFLFYMIIPCFKCIKSALSKLFLIGEYETCIYFLNSCVSLAVRTGGNNVG